MQMPLLRAATKTKRRRRRSASTRSRWLVLPLMLLLPLLQRSMGVVAHVATSGRNSPPVVTRAIRGARYTTPGATTWRSAGKSRILQSSSVSNKTSIHAAMVHPLGSRRASTKSSRRVTRRRRRRCRSKTPRGRSRPSTANLTLTPVPTSTASSSASCMVAPGTSRPGASLGCCAAWWQQLHPHRERRPTTSGWRHRLGSTPLTTPRTWQEPAATADRLPDHHQCQVVPCSD
jgi:hypothetical protein